MEPYWWSVAGLVLDICGAFLLAVEAIKLDNIRKLHDRYLSNISTGLESPWVIYPDDPDAHEKIVANQRRGFGRPKFYQLLHYITGAFLLVVIEIVVWLFGPNLADLVAVMVWHLPLAYRILTIILGGAFLVFAITWMLGEFVIHVVVQNTLKVTMVILEAIDRNTPTGATGIIGFVLLFFGFLGQVIGTIASAH